MIYHLSMSTELMIYGYNSPALPLRSAITVSSLFSSTLTATKEGPLFIEMSELFLKVSV